MRIKTFISSAIVLLSATSCGDWLDVQPSTQKDREELITSDEGYKQMLYGTYINLTGSSLYGHNLTYGLLEGLARNYCKNPVTNFDYKDTSSRGTIDDIWDKMYNNIANVNSILKDIDSHSDLFVTGEKELIEGEAYAMRAYMHFDLLRMFAPAYMLSPDVTAIPYVETYERVRYPHLPASTVIEKVFADLDKAESLMKEADDPIMTSLPQVTLSGKGDIWANRQYRFNYWAIQALRARVYMYIGDTANALKYAGAVIDDSPFTWVKESDIATGGDRIFISEMICGLDVPNLPNYYESYFKSESYSLSDGWGNYGLSVFEDANDYRYLYLMTNDKKNNKVLSCKYDQTIASSSNVMMKQTIPLIRLGEMYLIAAECCKETEPDRSISLLRDLKLHRGYLTPDRGISDDATPAQIQQYVSSEMRKETYAEGQMWFYWKRINSPTTPGFSPWSAGATTSMKTEYYTFPLPEDEKEYGNIPASKTIQ